MVPLDFHSGAFWTFWIGIVIGIAGFGLAYAGYVADQQTRAEIEHVQTDAQARIAAAQAEAQRRIDEVERKTAERRLNAEQRAAFVALFRPTHTKLRVSYMTGQGTGDVGALINDILEAAKTAGADIGGNGTVFGVLPPGISFQVNPDDKDMIDRLNVLARSIHQNVQGVSAPIVHDGEITVQIGPRTPGLP